MKKGLLVCIILLGGAGWFGSGKPSDFMRGMDGFRNYHWGTFLEEVRDALIPQGLDQRRNLQWFTKKDDPLYIGGANLESITYVFHDGKFAAVSIIAKEQYNYKALREELEERLGKTQPLKEDTFSWDLTHTAIHLTYNKQSKTAMLIIRAKRY